MAEILMKNIDKAVPVKVSDLVEYQAGKVASRTLADKDGAGVTLMAFEKGEGLSTHAAGGDAMAYILEGTAQITVGGVPHVLNAGEAIVMPCGVPHALKAVERFKMMLVVIFPEE